MVPTVIDSRNNLAGSHDGQRFILDARVFEEKTSQARLPVAKPILNAAAGEDE